MERKSTPLDMARKFQSKFTVAVPKNTDLSPYLKTLDMTGTINLRVTVPFRELSSEHREHPTIRASVVHGAIFSSACRKQGPPPKTDAHAKRYDAMCREDGNVLFRQCFATSEMTRRSCFSSCLRGTDRPPGGRLPPAVPRKPLRRAFQQVRPRQLPDERTAPPDRPHPRPGKLFR